MNNTEKMAMLKDLRAATSAGMNECKKALEECSFEFDKALDLVKARGLANTSRNADKVATEGALAIHNVDTDEATLVEINSNTDFTSQSKEFREFADDVASSLSVLSSEELSSFTGDFSKVFAAIEVGGSILSIEDLRKELMSKTKENIVIRRWAREEVSGDNRRVFSYLHSNRKIGVLLSMETPSKEVAENAEFIEFGNNVAMQIAAMNPIAVSADKIKQEERDRQKAIFETQLREAGKPEARWPDIMRGKMLKYEADVCLLNQESVFFAKKTVQALMDELSTKLCGEAGKVRILSFQRVIMGEGIEKPKTEDYGKEISAMTGIEAETKNTDSSLTGSEIVCRITGDNLKGAETN